MKTVIIFIITLHAVIHIVGFKKTLGQVPLTAPEFSMPIFSRLFIDPLRILWLSAGIVFLAAATFYFFNTQWWTIPCFVGIILSESLIIHSWKEARWGTVLNLILFGI